MTIKSRSRILIANIEPMSPKGQKRIHPSCHPQAAGHEGLRVSLEYVCLLALIFVWYFECEFGCVCVCAVGNQ